MRAGYIENWTYHTTYSGSPQGGIISPILANIYLNELDKFAENTAKEFYKERDRVHNKEYDDMLSVLHSVKYQLKTATGQQKSHLLKQRKELQKELRKIPCASKTDKVMKYIRYADDFIISVKGEKAD